MYNYIQKKLKSSHFYLPRFALASLGFALLSMQSHATGLQKAKSVLDIIKTEILSIVPIVAVIALIGLGIGYALNSVQKETFMRWAVGLIIVGSAAQITSMLLG
jgi:type IV secretory pathway VirB2 component (pilin)